MRLVFYCLLQSVGLRIGRVIKKDGSWGMHAQNYLLDQVKTAQAYLAKAQQIMDKGGYNKIATK